MLNLEQFFVYQDVRPKTYSKNKIPARQIAILADTHIYMTGHFFSETHGRDKIWQKT